MTRHVTTRRHRPLRHGLPLPPPSHIWVERIVNGVLDYHHYRGRYTYFMMRTAVVETMAQDMADRLLAEISAAANTLTMKKS